MIKFEVIRWKNFLSTGSQFTEIRLDRSPSTLIVGENGNGKSTILDSLVFVLYGTPYRNINKPQLVNSINKKDCVVELEFSVGPKRYKIIRGIKPNIFEIYLNDELLNQDAAARDYQKHLEENILKMNKKSFTQIVILGTTSFTPFMQLPAGHRREVIENLLDINIFTLMNQQLKEKLSEVKDLLKNIETEITIEKNKIEVQKKYIGNLESDNEKKKDDLNASIEKARNSVSEFVRQLDVLLEKKTDLSDRTQGKQSAESTRNDITAASRTITTRAKQIEKELAFYKDNDTCPTCSQNIDESHCNNTVDALNKELNDIKLEAKRLSADMATYDDIIKEFSEVEKQLREVNSEIATINARKEAAEELIETYEKELNKSAGANIFDEKLKLKEMARSALRLTEQKAEVTEQKHYYDVCATMLKDGGIKTLVIKQYLPVINKLVNKYLGMFDFFVSFELDESFNETIKSRHRDDFSYASFSEGEKQRIDLSLMMTWRSVAKLKNSATTNLLICDEILDGSLNQDGKDCLMRIFAEQQDTNLFVISHNPDSYFDKFRSNIRFVKENNYSKIEGA